MSNQNFTGASLAIKHTRQDANLNQLLSIFQDASIINSVTCTVDVGIYPFIHQIDRCHVLFKNNTPGTWKNQGKSLDSSILFCAYPLIMPASTDNKMTELIPILVVQYEGEIDYLLSMKESNANQHLHWCHIFPLLLNILFNQCQ